MQIANAAILGAAPVIAVRHPQGSNMDPNADYPETCHGFENCALLGYYAASSGNSYPTFRDYLSVPFEDETDRLCRNVG